MKAILGGIIGATLFAASAHAAIVQNGSFETGDFAGWNVTGGGITPGGGPRVVTTGNGDSTGYGDNVPNYDGTHAAFFVDDAANETISQVISLAGGTRYNLSFALFATRSGANNPNGFTLTSLIGGFSQTFTNADIAVGSWTTESGSFVTGASGDYTLSYNFQSGPTAAKDVLLDGVSLSAVPLPASAPLFGGALLGLAGLGYAAKRKKAAAAA